MKNTTTEARNLRTFLLVAELERHAISARIAQARREAGMTQEELADLLGVIPRTVQNYESHRVPWRHLKQIAEITGRPQAWFLHGDDPDAEEDEVRELVRRALDQLQDVDEKLDGLTALVRGALGREPPAAPEEDRLPGAPQPSARDVLP